MLTDKFPATTRSLLVESFPLAVRPSFVAVSFPSTIIYSDADIVAADIVLALTFATFTVPAEPFMLSALA